MDKANKKKLEDFKNAQQPKQGASMSQPTDGINPEMKENKDQPNTGAQPGAEESKEKKGGIFSIVIEKIKVTVVGGYTFAKESLGTAWNAVVDYYKSVRKNIEEKGVVRWFADGFRKSAYGFLKFSLKVTAFVLIHNLIVNATGFSILNPYFLLSILLIAVGMTIYSSVKGQKVLGKPTAKATGAHLMAEMIAA